MGRCMCPRTMATCACLPRIEKDYGMKARKSIPVLFLITGASLTLQYAAGQERATVPLQEKQSAEINVRSFLVPRRRSEATTAYLTRAGKPQQVKLIIQSWGVPHTKERLSFPEKGFFVVYFRARAMSPIINSEKQIRRPGEFWTVPQGAEMSSDVTSETATIETFSLP